MNYNIKELQKRLAALGFNPGPIDGVNGPKTDAAIVKFKTSVGLRARPFVGPLTWNALMQASSETSTSDSLPWMKEAMRVLGLDEDADNKELKKWLASDGHALGDPAKLPWCGDFVETAIRLGLPNEKLVGKVAENPYWALNWRTFGIPCRATRGAVASITRNGGGHVGFIMGEDSRNYYMLGGNQSNRVSIAPVAKNRFVSASFRWPASHPTQPINLPRMGSADGGSVVKSEVRFG